MDKVRDGTPKGFQSLCATCRNAQTMRGLNLQQETYCQVGRGKRITFPVESCSVYDDKRNPALWEMQQIAWVIHSRNRGPMGFTESGGAIVTVDPPSQQGPVVPPPLND